MKNRKFVSTLLLYSLLIQLPFGGSGCTSFYTAKGIINLGHFKDYEGKILLILKDNSEMIISPKLFYFVNKPDDLIFGTGIFYDFNTKKNSDFAGAIRNDIIDSIAVVSDDFSTYHLFWTKDAKRYVFKNTEFITITPESGQYFWIVRDDNTGEFKKIKNSNIQEIQLQEFDSANTGLTVLLVAALLFVGLLTAIAIDCGNHTRDCSQNSGINQ